MRGFITNPAVALAAVLPLLILVGALQVRALMRSRRRKQRPLVLAVLTAAWLVAFLTIIGARFALLFQ
jgi:hypothetical protein